MRRRNSYDELLARDLQDPKAAQVFLLGLIEDPDGLTLEVALKHTIQRIGIKEFCKKAKVSHPTVVAFIKGRRKIKNVTLDRYLKHFGLKAKLIAVKVSKAS